MYTQKTIIQNPCGLHARPAALFCKAAGEFEAEILLVSHPGEAEKAGNAKSILSVLTLGATTGTPIEIRADGTDEMQAVDTLIRLIASGLGESFGSPKYATSC